MLKLIRVSLFFGIFSLLQVILFWTPTIVSAQTVTTPPEFTYSGILRNGSGQVVSGMKIKLSNDTAFDQTQTASDGSYSLHVPAGTYQLDITNAGSTGGIDRTVVPGSSLNITASNFITINADTNQDFTIPTKTLTVTVLDPSNQPVQNASVDVRSASPINNVSLAPNTPDVTILSGLENNLNTDMNGQAVIPFIPNPSGSVTVTVTPPAGSNFGGTSTTTNFSSDTSLPVNLPQLFTYSGILRNGSGQIISGMKIKLSNSTAFDQTQSASDGSYSLHVPAGTYQLDITTAGSTTGVDRTIVPNPLNITASDFITISSDTNQDLTIPTKTLTVTVLDPSNQPVQNASVDVRSASPINNVSLAPDTPSVTVMAGLENSLTTDINGQASVPFIPNPSGTVTVTVNPSAGSNLGSFSTTTSFSSDTSLPINLPQLFTYSGILRNGSGQVVSGMKIKLSNDTAFDQTQTASDGSYSLHIPAGTYQLDITNAGSTGGIDRTIVPGSSLNITASNFITINSDTSQDLTIPTKTLTVTVLDPSNQPLQNTVADVRSASPINNVSLAPNTPDVTVLSGLENSLNTDINGQVVVPFIPNTENSVTINVTPPTDDNLGSLIKTISFLDNMSTVISYAAPTSTPTPTPIPSFNLSGVVYIDSNQNGVQDTGEQGYSGATVTLDNGDSTTTDSNGNYEFTNVELGTYVETLVVPNGYVATTANPINVPLAADTTENFGVVFVSPTNTPTPTATPTPAVTTLTPIADSYIKNGSQNENEGASTFLRIRSSGHNRALVKFDESQIQQAVGNNQNYTVTLQFTITGNGNNWGSTGRTIEVHRLLQDWAEGNGFIDGNSPSNRGTGSGVTWNCAIDTNIANQSTDCSGTTAWNMDNSSLWPFASAVTASTTITNNQTGIVSFDVTSDVQSFINGTTTNDGWLIKKTDEGAAGEVEFGSKDSGSTPELIITQH